MPTIVPPLNRLGRSGAEQRYPVACLISAVVLTAQGHRDDAQTLRFIAAHVAAAPASWPVEVCMCAVIPCTESDWIHQGHCCRVASDHQVPFAATHAEVCARHAHSLGGAR